MSNVLAEFTRFRDSLANDVGKIERVVSGCLPLEEQRGGTRWQPGTHSTCRCTCPQLVELETQYHTAEYSQAGNVLKVRPGCVGNLARSAACTSWSIALHAGI